MSVNHISLHLFRDTIKTIGVISPTIRVCRFTVLPTNGTAVTKVPIDTGLSSSSAVTLWQDASAEGTASASALTVTAGSPLTQQWTGRGAVSATTASKYEMFDPVVLFEGDLTLQALQGALVLLDNYSATTGNPLADRWVVTVGWEEFSRP